MMNRLLTIDNVMNRPLTIDNIMNRPLMSGGGSPGLAAEEPAGRRKKRPASDQPAAEMGTNINDSSTRLWATRLI